MGQGAFNVIEFAKKLGLTSLREMPVIERLQPVLIAGEFAGLTPQLKAPGGFAGGGSGPVAGQRSMIELHALGPGGAVVRAFQPFTLAASVNFEIGAPLLTGAGVVVQQDSIEPPVSVLRIGTLVFAPPAQIPIIGSNLLEEIDLFIPHGQAFRFYPSIDNSSVNGTVWFRDVPSSETPI